MPDEKINKQIEENTPPTESVEEKEQAQQVETAVTSETKTTAPDTLPGIHSAVGVKNTLDEINRRLLEEQNNFGRFVDFFPGDTVRVYVKIKEGNKERLQPYEGVVLGFQHGGPQTNFIVRRISHGVAVERVFPYHSPYLEKIEVVRRGRVRRAKLYFLRGRFGKKAKLKEKVNIKIKQQNNTNRQQVTE